MRWPVVFAVKFFPAVIVAVSFLVTTISFTSSSADHMCSAAWSSWSPVNSAVEYDTRFLENFPFFIHSSWFGEPTSAKEQAWEELISDNPIGIPIGRVRDLGVQINNEEQWVLAPGRKDNVLAIPEVYVQLACIRLLWQSTHRDEYNFDVAALKALEADVLHRVDQCIERLRGALMCTSDTAPVLKERPEYSASYADKSGYDFGETHTCRNLAKINDWMREQGLRDDISQSWWEKHYPPFGGTDEYSR